MSKISAVRFINLNYNDNKNHISDEIFYMNRQNTMINMANGSGKSVMVQMILSLFVHKRYQNMPKRLFAEYFTGVQPSFIMVEWQLDGSDTKVLTGMMVRKSQNRDSEEENVLDMVNFISEYRESCEYDIERIALSKKSDKAIKISSFADAKALFENLKRDSEKKFWYYDMNSGAGSFYYDKLAEYQIYSSEWESIVKKINNEESGLSRLFSDSSDEKGLIEKWFLPSIEDKIAGRRRRQNENPIKNYSKIVLDHAVTYKANISSIKRRDTLNLLLKDLFETRGLARDYKDVDSARLYAGAAIVSFSNELKKLLQNVNSKAEELREGCALLSDMVKRVEYEELSALVHKNEEERDYHLANMAMYAEERDALLNEEEKYKKRAQVLELARKQEEVNGYRGEYLVSKERLENLKRTEDEKAPERDSLGAALKEYYTKASEENNNAQRSIEQEIEEKREKLRVNKEEFKKANTALSKLTGEMAILQAKIDLFDREEDRFNKETDSSVSRNVMRVYETGLLEGILQEFEGRHYEVNDRRLKMIRLREDIQKKLRSVTKEIDKIGENESTLSAEVQIAQNELAVADAEIERRKMICKYEEIPAEKVLCKDVLIEQIMRHYKEVRQAVKVLEKQLDDTHNAYKRLTRNRIIELSNDLLEYFSDIPVTVVYGFEWLRKNGKSTEEKRELIARFPLLPYSMILSEADLARLEEKAPEVFTDFPVPIIVRERLGGKEDEGEAVAPELSEKYRTVIKFEGGEAFYAYFNTDLVSDESYNAEIKRLSEEEEIFKEKLVGRENEADKYATWLKELELSNLTPDYYDQLNKKIAEFDKRLGECKVSKIVLRDEHKKLEEDVDKISADVRKMDDALVVIKRQKDAVIAFSSVYKRYLEDIKNLNDKKTDISREENRVRLYENLVNDLTEKLEVLNISRITYENAGRELIEKLALYESFSSETPADGDISEIEAKFKAISEKLSGMRKILEEDESRNKVRYEKALASIEKLAAKYRIEATDWDGVIYSEEENTRISELIARKRAEIEIKKSKWASENANAKVSVSKTENALERLKEETGEETPMPKESIRNIDHQAEKSRLLGLIKQEERKLSHVTEKISIYQENINSLNDYDDLKGDETVPFTEDFEDMDRESLGRFKSELVKNLRIKTQETGRTRQTLADHIYRLSGVEAYSSDEFFSKPIASMMDISPDPDFYLEQLESVITAFEATKGKLETDLAVVESEREAIIQQLLDYVRDVNENLSLIDDNSTIKVRDRQLRMLKITVPEWSVNEGIYKVRVGDILEEITKNSMRKMDLGENPEEYIGTQISTRSLFDRVVGTNQVQIQLYKIEANSEQLVSWKKAAKNSGGEGFVCAFVVLACLLSYMRRPVGDVLGERNEGKVLIMDNPFAQTNAPHLLRPLMDMAKKANTQLICLTGLGGDAIYSCFDNIYVCNLIPTSLRAGENYLKKDHVRGSEEQDLLSGHIEVLGQQELLF